MHQTFYIDADEEISSVIDRLVKSMSSDNYFVVPKRALFLQSIVNLKILKREADKMRKRVTLVTQDEVAISMAERSGIEICDSLDGLEPTRDVFEDEEEHVSEKQSSHSRKAQPSKQDTAANEKRMRLRGVGSGEYYMQNDQFVDMPEQKRAIPAKKIKHAGSRGINLKNVQTRNAGSARLSAGRRSHASHMNAMHGKTLDPYKEKTLEKMFAASPQDEKNIPESSHIGSKKTKKFFWSFVLVCALVFLGAFAYLFLPSAIVVVTPNVVVKKIDVDLKSGESTDPQSSVIKARQFNQEEQFVFTYTLNADSGSALSGKKAQGKVTIFNEYSNDPQTLVASTRLKTSDGKIFHLVKNVVVPGFSQNGGQMKAGSVVADVVADAPGEDYNIEPTTFTVPGFEGGPKFAKFHAESDSAMTGGTMETQVTQGSSGVVQRDLDLARQKAEAAFKDKAMGDIQAQLQADEVILPQAQNISITKGSATAKVGSKVSSFDYIVTGTVQALIFSEKDVKSVILQNLKNDSQAKDAKTSINKIDYGVIEPDFASHAFALKAHGEITIVPNIDLNKLKEDLLGKVDDQLAGVMRKYPAIKSANVEFNPSFVTRIPQYSQRVTVEIKNEAQ